MSRVVPRIMRFALLSIVLTLASPACETRRPAAAIPPTVSAVASAPARSVTAPPPRAPGSGTTPPTTALAPAPAGVPVPDTGIYPDLDSRVRIALAPWLPAASCDVVATPAAPLVAVRGVVVAFAPPGASPSVQLEQVSAQDTDADGIPDQLDILIGGKKVALAAAPYKETYRQMPFPGGDIPRDEGVCTDVVIRALRNAGIDLQKLVHDDAAASPRSYPGIQRLDPNIDHRRVRNLVPYFKRHWRSLPIDPADPSEPWLPGDIVFLDTMKDPQPDHLGVVSDTPGPSGRPLIINSWTYGYSTSEMDLLSFVPVTHRFRAASPRAVRAPGRGLQGVLQHAGVSLASRHAQVLLVTSPTWQSAAAELRRYEREGTDAWRRMGAPISAMLGASGLGRGRGELTPSVWEGASIPAKREGDGKSPAGVFELGTAFGRAPTPTPMAWPWRLVDDQDRWVDDPASRLYNTWQRATTGDPGGNWATAEKLRDYPLAVVIRHNDAPILPGAGSAIFLHAWSSPGTPTTGCTAIDPAELQRIVAWLDPRAAPMLVQLPATVVD